MIVDELSKIKFSSFHKTKDRMIDPICTRLSEWREMGLLVENARSDDASENKKL